MNTSYFAKYKGNNGVSIAIKSPFWFKGPSYPDLFPKWDFLIQYKNDGDKVKYVESYYNEVLSKLDPQKVWDDLKFNTLLCWQRSDKFCHRHIVAKWLENSLGVSVLELD